MSGLDGNDGRRARPEPAAEPGTATGRGDLGRTTLLALVAAFFVPFFLAWFWFAWSDRLPLPGTTNHGILIQPVAALAPFSIRQESGERFELGDLQGRWTLLLVPVDGACTASCQGWLYQLRQIQRATGRDSERIRRVLVSVAPAGAELADIERSYPEQTLVHGSAQGLASLTGQLPAVGGDGASQRPLLYIVDPLGNVVMGYLEGTPADHVLEDLETLLRVSRVG